MNKIPSEKGAMHALLARQIRRHLGSGPVPAVVSALLAAVDDAYRENDRDRAMHDRALEISSRELLEANSQMRSMLRATPDLFLHVGIDGRVLDHKSDPLFALFCAPALEGDCRRGVVLKAEFAARFDAAINLLIRGESVACFDVEPLGADGRVFEVRIVMLFLDQAVIYVRDISERRSAEQELRNSVERFELVSRATFNAIWDWDLGTNVVWRNENYLLLFGYPSEEVEPNLEFWGSRVHSEDRGRTERGLYASLDSGSAFWTEEYRFRRKDGTYADVEDRGYIIRDAQGRAIRILGAMQDITEHKRAEMALAESELRFRTLIEQSPVALRMSRNGIIFYTNKRYLEMYGYQSMDKLRGQPVVEAWAPPSRARMGERIRRRSLGLEEPNEYEGVGQCKDGSLFPVHVTVTLVQLPDGVASMALITDITERKRNEAALHESTRQLLESQRIAGLGAYRLDLVAGTWESSLILDEIFGIDPTFRKDVPGWLSTVHPDQREEMTAYLTDEVLGKRQNFDREYRIVRHNDRQERWVHGLGELVADVEGRLVEMSGTIQDITERKRAEAALEESRQRLSQAQKVEAMGQLAGGIAHDFNNMLMAISAFGELALREIGPEHRAHPRVRQMLKAAERAAGLTKQLLAFSRKQVLRSRPIDLNVVVRNMETMLNRLLGEDIDLAVSTASGPGIVVADPGQIEQVVLNLAVNARDAMPKGGRVTIGTRNAEIDEGDAARRPPMQPGRYVMVEVSDTGIGMDAATQARIFEPFFTTKPEGQGTGLGLATVYGIVKQSGGFIWVYSEPGQGTTFKVYLPLLDEPVGAESVASARLVPSRGHECVLLVEDLENVREAIREMLEQNGYAVLLASNGEEALTVMKEHLGPVDLLLTDVVMPKLGGRDLAEQVLALRPGICVLYMSGYPKGWISQKGGLGAGIALLEKPFTEEQLILAVRDVLDRPLREVEA